jgi:hypothetical protein
MINSESRGIETRPTPKFGHRGNVEHLNFPVREIADVEFAVSGEQSGNDLPVQKSRVSARTATSVCRSQNAFARRSPEYQLGVSGDAFDRIAEARFKPVVPGDEPTIIGPVLSAATPAFSVAGSEDSAVRTQESYLFGPLN